MGASRLLLLVGFGLLFLIGLGARPASRQSAGPDLLLLPFVTTDVRVLTQVDAKLLIYNAGDVERDVEITALRVLADGALLEDRLLNATLPADPDYGRAGALIERLPRSLTELSRRNAFAPDGATVFAGSELVERLGETQRLVAELRERYKDPGQRPFIEPGFRLPLDHLFAEGAEAGTTAVVTLEVDYLTTGGRRRTTSMNTSIVWRGPRPGLPQSIVQGGPAAGTRSVHRGDLHVHSCHGEAVGACAPSTDCDAESFQTSGSFTYAALKSQYQALGLDWFTATDHSYCINSDSEYQTIVSETAALTDANFIVLPDIEVSSDEEGGQSGSDLADSLCLGLTSANHMGAHGLSARITGGGDGFLGFCDGLFGDVLDDFSQNAAAVRAQGGYPIINHPTAGSFAWNSIAATGGIESGQMHGVEIWNGAFQSGQGGNVGTWVDWLLAGRVLYAYSGSDTHDAAFDFGANHVVLEGGFSAANLEAALKAGSSYVSNGPALVLEVGLAGGTLMMGERSMLPSGAPAAALDVRAHYNFGLDSGRVSLFEGRVGDSAETLLCQSASVTGEGVFSCAATLAPSVGSWYRAYLESDDGTQVAYSNPVFFRPGSGTVFPYCIAKPNALECPVAIGGSGTPSASLGSGFFITADDAPSNRFGLLFYGLQAAFAPFQDGTRCVAFPVQRTAIQNSGGNAGPDCSGTFTLDFNARIASGVDPGLTAGTTVFAQYWYRDPASAFPTGLTDALQLTIQP